ncbi:putative sulfate/molybdate transporter [Halomonas sp. SpR8]|uniref:putative sulfate/molybdate transporter n=1 Tax=Halomonas sp. SpR8 TaxID=3050463 RepID=UPI0027E441EF|nr:putative sulfate/molybdate transporter [Halomonas sp. SpR8]MDQ7727016.1 putative sulfate/molybdate transporter [Halomonas sp. SpR8]
MYGGEKRGRAFEFTFREFSGALGDLGTLLPLMLGTIALIGLAPTPVLLGFALFYIGSAFYYRLPIPVQPMKAVAAAMLTAGIAPGGLAVSGMVIGLTLLILGGTGWIKRIGRLVPQSVLAGLQLGLGIVLGYMSIGLMLPAPLVAIVTLGLLLGLLFFPRYPAVLIALIVSTVLAQVLNTPGLELNLSEVSSGIISIPSLPTIAEFERALSVFVLPQLSLTFTNAILLTALLAVDYHGERASHVTPVKLSITSGLANLILTPFGALPMCHGAGGVTAHYRFGARSGAAPLMLGLALIAFALIPGGVGLTIISAIPVAGLGALLFVTAGQLAVTKRLFDCKRSCWPVIAITTVITVLVDPFWGLLAGGMGEIVRKSILCYLQRRTVN